MNKSSSIKSYIISLKYPFEKIDYLKKFGIYPEYIEGIDGNKLSQNDINNYTESFICRYFIPLSVIGCGLAHIKAWKTFLNNTKEPYAIFFEDDVLLDDNFNIVIDKAMCDLPNDFDILYLGCFACNKLEKNEIDVLQIIHYPLSVKSKQISKNIDEPSLAYGTHCYILSRKGAEKLIFHIGNNIYQHIDFMIQYLRYKNIIKAYSVNPLVAFQTSTLMIEKSMNVSYPQPYIIMKPASYFNINKHMNTSYLLNVKLLRIGMCDISLSSVIFILGGVICSLCNFSINKATILFLCLMIPDLVLNFNEKQTIFNYIFFVFGYYIYSLKK